MERMRKRIKRGNTQSVIRRWLLSTLGVILLILILIHIAFIISITSYFYNSAKQILVSSANSNYNIIQSYAADSSKNLASEIQNIVRNYEDKDKIELMAVDYNGTVSYTSSSFSVKGDLPMSDYNQALSSADGIGFAVMKSSSNEPIMAYTQLIQITNNEYSALRYVVSLSDINGMIAQMWLILFLISLLILAFVIVSGSFFINSIVHPVRDISDTVQKITDGNLNVRIHRRKNDELGDLCDAINKMADELSYTEKMKNEFISSISHELRTPLTAIQGWSETMLNIGTEDQDTMQKGMEVILNETERLSGMVEDLLDFSRIQGGNFRMVKDRMDVLAELEEAALIYTERAKRDNKILTYEESEILPVIMGDKNRIRQVFINIIDNALKYTDPGDHITISSTVDEQSITITVEDTGCGIAKEDLPFVKEKFHKANHTRPGSGIGLAVSTEIIQNHDGWIDIQSEEGKGTKVTIQLPIYKEEANKIVQTFDEPSAPQ